MNVKGTLFTAQKALPLFPDKTGTIILTGSTAGTIGDPGFSVYGGTKAALRQMARNWIMDLKDTGIRLNVLSRLGTTQEIADAAMFLASADSSYVSGIEWFVDGGVAQV